MNKQSDPSAHWDHETTVEPRKPTCPVVQLAVAHSRVVAATNLRRASEDLRNQSLPAARSRRPSRQGSAVRWAKAAKADPSPRSSRAGGGQRVGSRILR